MQETTMVVMTLYGILSITLFVLWIKHKSVLRQRQKLASKIGSMKGNLVQTSEKLDLLSRGSTPFFPTLLKSTSYWEYTSH
ncbi:MAG: hypothetical protein Ct9H90mP24_6890 [Methanobacteriota archaeon]|nr:MAG: hypothetical protein Ct9H90mP24_6890 [Euryarchaeota archaeon]